MISWIVIPGIIGAVFCATGKSFHANVIWSLANILMIRNAYTYGDSDSMLLFSVYEIIAVIGVARTVKERFKNPSFRRRVNLG